MIKCAKPFRQAEDFRLPLVTSYLHALFALYIRQSRNGHILYYSIDHVLWGLPLEDARYHDL